jgi:hypothetical protein
MIEQNLLSDIISDTSFGGKFTKFYEMLQEELSNYSHEKIESIKQTLIFDKPELTFGIQKYDKLKVLYEYSLLP